MPGELEPQQARKTAIQLGLPTEFIKKDFFVTKIIQTLTKLDDEYFSLIFQGGTSLSKGYQVIHRLSEDVDFRVIQKPRTNKLGRDARRKRLRDFRYALVQSLKDAGFNMAIDAINVYYEGRYMSIRAEFDDSQQISYLKPHVAIDCFLGELALPPTSRNITSLIKLTLGHECEHTSIPVMCVALDETAAEKWVALTRRIAATQIKMRLSDKHLVRHLYDLYHLKKAKLLSGNYCSIVNGIIEKDKIQFKKHHAAYADDPLRTSKLALDLLVNDKQWQEYWDIFLDQMVYEKNKPNFDEAYRQLHILSQEIINELECQQE